MQGWVIFGVMRFLEWWVLRGRRGFRGFWRKGKGLKLVFDGEGWRWVWKRR